MASIRLQLDKNVISQKLIKELEEVNNPTTMIAIYNTLAKMCDPYVPFLNGPLSQTHQISEEGVRYVQPYARYQYYGTNFNFTKDYHPLASAMWDKAMLADRGTEFNEEVKDIIVWRIKRANR